MNKSNEENQPSIDQRFLQVMTQHKQGDCISDMSAAIKQVTAAVQLTGKAGKVTLELNIKPASKGAVGTLILDTKVKAKVPETESYGSIFYADEDYNLVREDPKQAKLNLKVVGESEPTQPSQLREAGNQ